MSLLRRVYAGREDKKGMKKRHICCAMIWCFVTGTALADGEKAKDDAAFRWSWEKKRAVQSDPAKNAVAKDKLLRQLMEKNRTLSKDLEEASKNNAILVQELQTAKRKAQVYAAAAAKAEAEAGKKPTGDGGSGRYAATLSKLLKENADLKVRIAELEKRSTGTTGTVTPGGGDDVGGSDLFKAQEQERMKLKQRVQELTVALGAESKARQELETKTATDASRIAELEKRAEDAEHEATLMEQRQKKLLAEAGRGIRLENEAEEMKQTIDKQTKEIHSLKTENVSKLRMLDNAEKNISVLRGEREDLYFNIALLYTTAEMYEDAERAFVRLAKLTPDAADVHYNLGVLYDQHLKTPRKASAHYRKYLELAPDSDDSQQVKVWLAEMDVKM